MSQGGKFRSWIKRALLNSLAMTLLEQTCQSGVAVLRYHSIQDELKRYANSIGDIIHGTTVFEEQMQLVAQKFNPVTLDDIVLYLFGEKAMPRRAVAVTFDDGFTDNFDIAAPILDRFGIRASFYITVNSVEAVNPPWFCRLRHAFTTTQKKTWQDSKQGRVRNLVHPEERNAAFLVACERCAVRSGDTQEQVVRSIEHILGVEPMTPKDSLMMNWDQIRELHRSGHIIGSHTLTHPNLAYVRDQDLYRELIESKRRLEKELGGPVVHFSYPSPILEPHYAERTMVATKQVGYRTAVTCTSGPVRTGDNPLSLKRIWVPSQRDDFLWNLEWTLLGRSM